VNPWSFDAYSIARRHFAPLPFRVRENRIIDHAPVTAGNLIVTPVEMLDGSRLSAMALSYPFEGFLYLIVPFRIALNSGVDF